jgi:Fur family ferric uptake transcriptional regulator
MRELQALMDRVREYGWRITRQRAIILQTLCELDRHASAEEIHERVALHRRDVDLSTVYRTLESLRDLHIISQTDLGRGCAEFEILDEPPHHHLICTRCGSIHDLGHDRFEAMTVAIHQETGFFPRFDHVPVFGVCSACRQGGRANSVEGTAVPRSVPNKEEQT